MPWTGYREKAARAQSEMMRTMIKTFQAGQHKRKSTNERTYLEEIHN
jgi:hypothetical protein